MVAPAGLEPALGGPCRTRTGTLLRDADFKSVCRAERRNKINNLEMWRSNLLRKFGNIRNNRRNNSSVQIVSYAVGEP